MNATIYGAVTRANQLKVEIIGLIKGFNCLFNPRVPHVHLNPLYQEVPELDPTKGGTLIGSSRDYVDPNMQLGDSTNKLIECFGQPYHVYETGTHELSLNFSIPDSNLRAYTNGVGGVTAFFTNNQLVQWDPIYVRGPAPT